MTVQETLSLLDESNPLSLFFLFYVENGLIAMIGITIGFCVDGTIGDMFKKISRTEVLWTLSTVFFNSIVTLTGYELFKHHIVIFDFELRPLNMLIDFIVLVASMDLLMYLFHLVIHRISFVYKYHDLHHHYDKPTPISLFVLHPVEVLGFGILWLILISTLSFSFVATLIYLIFNVVMGLIGHLENEFVPALIKHNKYLKWLATTSFHRDHHADEDCNYGFYTSIWDRLFGTWQQNET
jgi:Delta7-sterol 5-desaturase